MSDPKAYLLTAAEQDAVNGRNAVFEAELYGEDEFMTVFNTETDLSVWQWATAAQIAETLNVAYKGLNIRSESIGGRLLPRIERRTGKVFERKISHGRRLILCPPKTPSGCGTTFTECDDDFDPDITFGATALKRQGGAGSW
jgi:hypothetical protein